MRKFLGKHSTIRSELTWLVVACVLPVWLVSASLVCYAYFSKVERVKRSMLENARSTALTVDAELSKVAAALVALATSPSFVERDFEKVHRQSRELLKSYPGADIIVADSTGQQLVNSYRPFGAPLPKRNNTEIVRRVFETAKPVVGNLFRGAVTGRHLIPIDVPVMRDGRVVYDLSMTFTSERLSVSLRHPHLAEGWATILDSRGVVVATTSADPERHVGKKHSPEVHRALALAPFGTFETKSLEGVPVLLSYCRSSVSGWSVLTAVPKAVLMSEIYHWVGWAVGGATAISLFGIVLAMCIGRRIARSIQSLVGPAISIGRGEAVTATGFQSVTETIEVSEALVEASKLLQHHKRTVQEQQLHLEQANELLELRVRERTLDLEAALREHEAFSYSVSHDLRAPLRHMNSYSIILEEDYRANLPEEGRVYLERICAATRKMGALIDNLLELSRINKVMLKYETVDLSSLAASTLRMFQETEPQRAVDAVIEVGLKARGDHSLLGQLLQNLLGNAWKYTSKRDSGRIEFGTTDLAGEKVFFVKDNGAGFDMEYRHRLFKAFERLHGTEFEGIGVGLATAQRVIQRHGGAIWAEGKIDGGATFYFTLPA